MADNEQEQTTEETSQPLGIEDQTNMASPRYHATDEDLINISRRQMERQNRQAPAPSVDEVVAESEEVSADQPAPEPEKREATGSTEGNPLLSALKKILNAGDEYGIIMAETIMLACGFIQDEVQLVNDHGVQDIANLIDEKIKYDEFNDTKFINNLFTLQKSDLEQLPISFYASVVKSNAFKSMAKNRQNEIFGKIFDTVDLPYGLDSLEKVEADKVALNYEAYQALFSAYAAVNATNKAQEISANEALNEVLHSKTKEVLANAPALTNMSFDDRQNFDLLKKNNGDHYKAADEALSYFNDTKALTTNELQANAINMGSSQEYYYPVQNAKLVLAEKKMASWVAAAQIEGVLFKEGVAEKYSVVDQADKENPVTKFVNSAKNVAAYYSKPQNVAKVATKMIATQAINRGIAHFVGAALPGVGAAVNLAMKLGECGKRIWKDKENPKEVFSQALPDLARGVVTVGLSVTPIKPLAGPIAAVASTVVRGMQVAHKEGLKVGDGFFKRVAQEFKKKETWRNLGLSAAGAVLGAAGRGIHAHMQAGDQEMDVVSDAAPDAEADVETDVEIDVEASPEVDEMSNLDGNTQMQNDQLTAYKQAMQNQHAIQEGINPVGNGSGYYVDDDGVLRDPNGLVAPGQGYSEVDEYILNHPGAHLDKNGWMQNADGSYAKNDKGQLWGSEDRVFRALKDDETLDKAGNIIKKPVVEMPREKVWDAPRKAEQMFPGDKEAQEAYIASITREKKFADMLNRDGATAEEKAWTQQQIDKLQSQRADLMQGAQAPVPAHELTEKEIYQRNAETMRNELNDVKKINPMIYKNNKEHFKIMEKEAKIYEELSSDKLSANKEKRLLEQLNKLEAKENGAVETQATVNAEQAAAEANAQVMQDNVAEELEDEKALAKETLAKNAVIEEKHGINREHSHEAPAEETVKQPEPQKILRAEDMTVRSKEELAKIDALRVAANKARAFNSLPEKDQRELIDLQAQMQVAKNHGDMESFRKFKQEFDTKFEDAVFEDKQLDAESVNANMKGSFTNQQRELEEQIICDGLTWDTPEEKAEAIKNFQEKWGTDMGNGKNGVRQFVRKGGLLKIEVPDVPEKNFLELGGKQQTDGSWVIKNRFSTEVIHDVNNNGIPDAGDTYEKVTEIGKPGTAFYSKEVSKGVYVEQTKEQINPSYNGKKALEARIQHFEEIFKSKSAETGDQGKDLHQ